MSMSTKTVVTDHPFVAESSPHHTGARTTLLFFLLKCNQCRLSRVGCAKRIPAAAGDGPLFFYLLQQIIFDLLYLLYLLFGLIFRGLQRADLARA